MDSDEVLDLKAQLRVLELENRALRQRTEGPVSSDADRSFLGLTVVEGDRIDICGGLIQVFIKGRGRSEGSHRVVVSAPRDLLVKRIDARKMLGGS